MIRLNLPQFEYKIKRENNKTFLFDIIRKKFIVLTPEEWVRQHFINYLINYLHYPKALIKVEGGHKYNTRLKRSDIVVYDRSGKAFIIVECKAATEQISEKAFDQVSRYNLSLNAQFLVITNGLSLYCCAACNDQGHFEFLPDIPSFKGE